MTTCNDALGAVKFVIGTYDDGELNRFSEDGDGWKEWPPEYNVMVLDKVDPYKKEPEKATLYPKKKNRS